MKNNTNDACSTFPNLDNDKLSSHMKNTEKKRLDEQINLINLLYDQMNPDDCSEVSEESIEESASESSDSTKDNTEESEDSPELPKAPTKEKGRGTNRIPPAIITAMNNRFKTDMENGGDDFPENNPAEDRLHTNEHYMRADWRKEITRTKGFNADFDGDELAYVPQHTDTENNILMGVVKSIDATKDKCGKKVVDSNGVKTSCGNPALKYKMCSYHWGVWRREHPYLKAPGKY